VPSHLEQLWLRFVHGEDLSSAESAQLATYLGDRPATAKAFVEDRRLHGALRVFHELSMPQVRDRFVDSFQARQVLDLDGDRFSKSVDQKLSTRNIRRTKERRVSGAPWLTFLAGFGCAAALAFGLWRFSGPALHPLDEAANTRVASSRLPSFDPAGDLEDEATQPQHGGPGTTETGHGVTITRVSGRVSVVRGDTRVRARAGMSVADDNGVTTESGGEATLVYSDGTVIELGRGTVLRSVAKAPPESNSIFNRRVVIEKGWIHARVTPASESKIATVFHTDVASIRVTGTELSIAASSTKALVAIEHGSVEIMRSADGARVRLRDNQWVEVADDRPFVEKRVLGEIALVTGRLGPNEGERGGSHALNEAEVAIRDRLEAEGWRVKVFSDDEVSASDAVGKSLVIISSTVESVLIDPAFRDLAVPILCFEVWTFDDLGMTASGETNRHPGQTSVHIASSHPMAAGLAGVIRVSHAPFAMAWGAPALTAMIVATTADSAGRAVIFGYERGTAMYGTVAPARRVGFFLADDTATTITEDGWKLFDAAIRWSVSR
jgi:FecR protein